MSQIKEDLGNIGKLFFKDNYKKALEALKDVLKRKTEKNHDVSYYAARVAKGFKGVEPRLLAKMVAEEIKSDILPQSGAGQEGTDTLVNNYVKDTPGQVNPRIVNFKRYIKDK
jgi:hypothetical protein